MIGENRKIYLVIGLSGAGKSFVCSSVAPYSYRVKFDRLRGGEKRRQVLEQASQQHLPIVADITKLVSTTIKLNPEFQYSVVFVNESLDIIRQRVEERGGRFNELASQRRQARLQNLSQRYGAFSGTADECTQWLKHELRVTNGVPETSNFYVYGIYELGPKVLRYVGKGHRNAENGYDRIDHYDQRYFVTNRRQGIVFDRLRELISQGKRYVVEIITDGLTEYQAFNEERAKIRECLSQGISLWNQSDGGRVGWTLSAETREKMSASRKGKKYGPRPQEWKDSLKEAARRRAADPAWRAAHSAKLLGKPLSGEHRQAISASLKGRGRPKGWAISEDEAQFLGILPGRAELTDDQKLKIRNYRYKKAMKRAECAYKAHARV